MDAGRGREHVCRVSACPAPSTEEHSTRPWERAPVTEPANLSGHQSGAEKRGPILQPLPQLSPGGQEQELHILATTY